MAEVGGSEEVSGRADVRDHMDNLVVFIVLVTLLVSVGQNIGRWIGRRTNSAGLTAFFGG